MCTLVHQGVEHMCPSDHFAPNGSLFLIPKSSKEASLMYFLVILNQNLGEHLAGVSRFISWLVTLEGTLPCRAKFPPSSPQRSPNPISV